MSKTIVEVLDMALKEFDCGRVYVGAQMIKEIRESALNGSDAMFNELSHGEIVSLMKHKFNSDAAEEAESGVSA